MMTPLGPFEAGHFGVLNETQRRDARGAWATVEPDFVRCSDLVPAMIQPFWAAGHGALGLASLEMAVAPLVNAAIGISAPDVTIYGTARAGLATARLARRLGLRVSGFVDSDPSRWGDSVAGIHIVGLETAIGSGTSALLLTSVEHHAEMERSAVSVAHRHGVNPLVVGLRGAFGGEWWRSFDGGWCALAEEHPGEWRQASQAVEELLLSALSGRAPWAVAFCLGCHGYLSALKVLSRLNQVPVAAASPFVYAMQ